MLFKKPLGWTLEYGLAKFIIFELTILGSLRNIENIYLKTNGQIVQAI